MKLEKPLIILDIANNHQGFISKGLDIINDFNCIIKNFKEFNFAIKFQYRQLNTFIHPDFKDNQEYHYIKRFKSTELQQNKFFILKEKLDELNILSCCTPFDNESVNIIEEQNFNYIKIASCSITDWPLLERIVKTNFPIIASTAGTSLEDLDKVYSFFKNRKKDFAFMHCVAEYPTQKQNLQLNQIDLLKSRYDIPIGFSTHEFPDNYDSIKIAIAKGANLLEKHIDLDCDTKNAYSCTPKQLNKWLESALDSYKMCGGLNYRYISSTKEKEDLKGLRRALFIKQDLKKGDKLTTENVFFAIPIIANDQLTANDFSKYTAYFLNSNKKKNESILSNEVTKIDSRNNILEIVKKLKDIIIKSGIALPDKIEMELSTHFGIKDFYTYGAAILNCLNKEEYCKKLIIMLPNQIHPMHHHVKKTETFFVLYGDLLLTIVDKEKTHNTLYDQIIETKNYNLKAGDQFTVDREVPHSFSSKNGCIFEEVSTTHYLNDSFYIEKEIMENKDRKISMTFCSDWLTQDLK